MVIMMSTIKRVEIPIGIFIICSVVVLARYYFGIGTDIVNSLTQNLVIVWTFTYIIGAYSLSKHHIGLIQRRRPGWYYSLILFGSAITFFVLYYINSSMYTWVQTIVLTPLQMAMLSYVGMFMYTVMFRGVRSRSIDAAVLLIVTILLLIYMMPLGPALWPGFQTIGDWINTVPNSGVQRGVLIGIGLGTIALMIRTWLGMEKSYLGGE